MSKKKIGSKSIDDGAANGIDGRRAPKKKSKVKADYQIDIRSALEDPVRVMQDGKSQKVSAFEITIRQHLKKSLLENSVTSMKFIIEQAEKYKIIKTPPAPPSGGIFIVPKGLPESVEREIFEHRPVHGEREPMSRIFSILRRTYDELKRRSKAE
jgi:hypothetical protein